MRWIADAEVRRRLDVATAIALVDRALQSYRLGRAEAAPRTVLEHDGSSLVVMPGRVEGVRGLKVLSIRPQNRAQGLPTTQGLVVVLDGLSGQPLGTLAADALTRIRTAAIAGQATRALAPEDATTMFLAGAGAQARDQVEAVLAVRPIRQVLLWNRSRQGAEALAQALTRAHPEILCEVVGEPREACRAQVVTLATSACEPLLGPADVAERCHINAMGSFRPHCRELSGELVAGCRIYADTLPGCLEEAGDLLLPLEAGLIKREQVSELAEARPGPSPRTLMKSVGSAIFDLACAAWLLQDDRRPHGLGADARLTEPADQLGR